MIDPRLAWFAIGAACSAVVFGWPWHPRFSRFSHENTAPDSSEARPRKFHNICNDDHRLDSVALWRPVRFDEGPTARNTSRHGPVAPKPRLIPRGTRSITFPDPSPDRQPTNPFTGDPVKPQPSGGRLITEGEWRAEWASIDDDGSFSLGLVRDHNLNPPPSDP